MSTDQASMNQRRTETVELPAVAPGNRRGLTIHRYGTGRPKAYLHAALHADEWPGILVLQHLLERLDATADAIRGEIVVVPFANPVGLGQFLNGYTLGRYDFDLTGNFNRSVPPLGESLLASLADRLGDDAVANTAIIRAALRDTLAELRPQREGAALKAVLLGHSIDADYVFDIHCDHEALLHIYAPRDRSDLARQLAADMECAALLLEDDPGGDAFDQANSSPWRLLRAQYGERVALGCFACTLELRGQSDVDDTLAARDAAGLYRFLQRCGVIDGVIEEASEYRGLTVPLEGVDVLRSPGQGLLAYRHPLGTRVEAGAVIAELVDPEGVGRRTPIHANTAGLLFTRARDKLVRPGQAIAKIAGGVPLDYRKAGTLLQD